MTTDEAVAVVIDAFEELQIPYLMVGAFATDQGYRRRQIHHRGLRRRAGLGLPQSMDLLHGTLELLQQVRANLPSLEGLDDE